MKIPMPVSALFETVQRLRTALSPTRKLLAEVRASWGRAGTKDGWLASRYFELTSHRASTDCVDDTTWNDLEFPKLFSDLDTSVTPLGGQTLFRQMRTYLEDPSAIHDRYAVYDRLRSDRCLRETIQLQLSSLRADSNASIAEYVFGASPGKPRHQVLIVSLSLLSAATLAGVLALPVTPFLWLSVLAVNLLVFHLMAPRMDRDAEGLKGCDRLLRTADRLSAIQPAVRAIPACS